MSTQSTATDTQSQTPTTPKHIPHNPQTPFNQQHRHHGNPYSRKRAQTTQEKLTQVQPKGPRNNTNYHTRQDLQQWLTFARQGIQPDTPHHPILQSTTSPSSYEDNENTDHWGDPVILDKPKEILRVLSRNVDTLSIGGDFLAWQAAAQALTEYQVDVASFQETNIQWNRVILQRIRQIFLGLPPKRAKITVSQSQETVTSNYKPGGTSTRVLGTRTTHVVMDGQDPHGLGRWSYMEFEGSNA